MTLARRYVVLRRFGDALAVSRDASARGPFGRNHSQPTPPAVQQFVETHSTTEFGSKRDYEVFFFTPTFSIRVLSVSSCECSTKTLPCYPLHRSTAAALMFKSLTSIYPQAAATYQSCAPRCLTQYRTHQQPCNRSAKCNGRTKQDGEAA